MKNIIVPIVAFILALVINLLIFYVIKEDFFPIVAIIFIILSLLGLISSIVFFKRFITPSASFVGLVIAVIIYANIIGLISWW